MNNKAVQRFLSGETKKIKYGKWLFDKGILYFNYMKVAERKNDEIVCYDKNLVNDCNFEYNTYHAIARTIKYIRFKIK